MADQFRLIGGPRDSEVTDTVPNGYWIVDSERFDRPVPEGSDLFTEDARFVARWRGDDLVYLTDGLGLSDGELVRRADLPDDALKAVLQIEGAHIDGADPGKYDVYTVER